MEKYISKCEGGYSLSLSIMDAITKAEAVKFTSNSIRDIVMIECIEKYGYDKSNVPSEVWEMVEVILKATEAAELAVTDFEEELDGKLGYELEFDMGGMGVFIPEERVEYVKEIK